MGEKVKEKGMDVFSAHIRRAKNGLILTVVTPGNDPEEVVFQEQYSEKNDPQGVECFADFLRLLDEEFGPATSRHDPKRIRIAVEPGDKYENPQK